MKYLIFGIFVLYNSLVFCQVNYQKINEIKQKADYKIYLNNTDVLYRISLSTLQNIMEATERKNGNEDDFFKPSALKDNSGAFLIELGTFKDSYLFIFYDFESFFALIGFEPTGTFVNQKILINRIKLEPSSDEFNYLMLFYNNENYKLNQKINIGLFNKNGTIYNVNLPPRVVKEISDAYNKYAIHYQVGTNYKSSIKEYDKEDDYINRILKEYENK